MKYTLLVLITAFLFGCGSTEPVVEETPTIVLDSTSSYRNLAFEYLNRIRSNPSLYRCTDCNFDLFEPRPPLKHNPNLHLYAAERAYDMAKNGYTTLLDTANVGIDMRVAQRGYKFDSTNYDKSSSNYGTSTYSFTHNTTITSMIDDLIRGPGRFSSGDDFYRYANSQKLLMGLNSNERLDEIGIGFCYSYNKSTNSNYKYYLCVIVAKQKK